MKFLLCGTIVPEKFETKIPHLSNAANRFLLNFCNGVPSGDSVKIISYIGIGTEDRIKKELCKTENENYQLFFKSKYILKGVWRYLKHISRQIRECDCLITYNVIYAWILAPYIARFHKKKSLLILADFSPSESYVGLWRKLYAAVQLSAIRKYDYVVGLSNGARHFLSKNQKFICVEGGISESVYAFFDSEMQTDNTVQDRDINLMYAGILEPVTGIDLLLEAFTRTKDPKLILMISGKGSLEERVRQAAERDQRIRYLGCPAYEIYMQNLRQADVLINPRNMNLPENANNFPSKIMEYLATGKYILSTRFPGWKKFADYIDFCDASAEDLYCKITDLAENGVNWSELKREQNREFAKEFLWNRQTAKILGMVTES